MQRLPTAKSSQVGEFWLEKNLLSSLNILVSMKLKSYDTKQYFQQDFRHPEVMSPWTPNTPPYIF